MNNKDEVLEYLIAQLRQRVNSNQCEDLAHEVQSLKNQLRDASALVAELRETIKLMNEDFNRVTGRGGPLPKGYSYAVGGHGPEQSGCWKQDTHGCEHEWVEFHGLFIAEGDPRNEPRYTFCRKCGLKEYSRKCEHEWSYVMGDAPGVYECDVCGAQSKTLPYDLRWLA
ncbi:hypothetical protein phi135_12 [Salmonella phage vB_SenS_phi135]|nr:hypothetical protein phi135_12 [Salmonella phage vB_SenS_phi135]